MNDCKAPQCQFSQARQKCIKPNPYIEALSWCTRNKIPFAKCIDDYNHNKQAAKDEACARYEEKLNYVKPSKMKDCPESKVRNPRTGRCIKIKVKKDCPEGKVRNPKTGRCIKIKPYLNKYKSKVTRVTKTSKASNTQPKISHTRINVPKPKSLTKGTRGTRGTRVTQGTRGTRVKRVTRGNTSAQYSRVFERKNPTKHIRFATKPHHKNPFVNDLIPRDSLKDGTRLVKLKKIKVKRHPFIADLYDKKIKQALSDRENTSLEKALFNSSSLSRSRSSHIKTKLKSVLKHYKATKLQQFFKKHLLVKYFTLRNRVNYFQYVREFLKDLPKHSCIKPKSFKSRDGMIYHGYTIDNIVDLQKQIGTKSAYGVIYKTSVKNMLGSYPIACKLVRIDDDSKNEIEINEMISNKIVKKHISRHFLLSYKTFECAQYSQNVPSKIMFEEYYVSLNELAHGDLFQLCQNPLVLENEELLINLGCQCMLSIMTFHSMGYLHFDTHWGNLLYHINEDKQGYYHYRINNQNYYLKSCMYTLMLYDFGFSLKFNDKYHKVKDYSKDLHRIFLAFRNHNYGGWYKEGDKAPSDSISKYFDDLSKVILRSMIKYQNKDKMYEEVLITFLNAPVKGVFLNVKPPNGKILNEKPFIIDNSLEASI